MDEEFTTTAYLNVQENLKLPTEDQVRLEEPASSAGTMSSLQNLDKELSFTDQFLVEKSQEDEPRKTNTESEVQSMVTIPIHQDTSYVPLMTTLVIDLTVSQPVSTTIQAPLPTSTATVTTITTTTSLPPIPPQPQQGFSYSILIQRIGKLEQHMADMVSKAVYKIVTDAVDWVIQAPLRDRFRDLPKADMKEILHHPDVIYLQYQMEECHKLLTDQVDDAILRYNVSKPLALGGPQAYYPDLGLEQMVLDQMWIEEECKYNIAAMYDISHWWFQRQQFYIDRHTSEGDRRGVRTHMRILSVVRIEVFSLYGYDYMKTIVLRRADLQEHIIAERDFKYLYPSDFKYMYLLNLQGHLNHLPPKDKKILTTAVNLWTRNLVIRQQIDEALDYRFKEFKVNRMNPGLNTWFWSTKNVDRSKEFMFAIQKRLKTRRIFRNLERFVGGQSVLTDPEVHVKMEMEIPRSSRVNSQPHAHT
ncbi:hypothetical protein Tco_0518351 [Tanacetum coccineum]